MFQSIAKRLKRFKTGIKYAAGYEFDGHKSDRRWTDIPHTLASQDDVVELSGDREYMISAARGICQLFGLGNRVLRMYANYVVGECEVYFCTSDDRWNDQANEFMSSASKLIDLRGREDLKGMARRAMISMLRDGDIGFEKIKNSGYPLLNPIEADRIGPRQLFPYSKEGVIGGIEYDSNQRPIAFNIADRGQWRSFVNPRRIAASSFIHVYDPMRFDASRGLSAFANGALGRSRSLKGILQSEETAVHTMSKWAVLIKSMQGGVPSDDLAFTGETVGTNGNATGAPVEQLHDGMIQRLLPGEDVQSVGSNRPGPAWQGFVEFLIRDFSVSLDLPYEFVWNMTGLTGPSVRMVSKQAERTFRNSWSVLNDRFLVPTISWVIANAIESGQLPFNSEFYKFYVQKPSHPSIDMGRDSSANLNEHKRGLMSGADIVGEKGGNIYRTMEQKAREVSYAVELSKKYNIPLETLIELDKQAPAAPSKEAEPIELDDDDEEMKEPQKPKQEELSDEE